MLSLAWTKECVNWKTGYIQSQDDFSIKWCFEKPNLKSHLLFEDTSFEVVNHHFAGPLVPSI